MSDNDKPDPWAPIEYDEGYPVDEGFGHFCRHEPPLDFWRAAHWLLSELPRACEFMCCWCKVTDGKDEYGGEPVKLIEFSTGGWSGAESIIGLIERRFDMAHFMKSWERGGHFVFEIPAHFLRFASTEDATRARDRDREADETRSGSVERSEIEPGRDSDAPITSCTPISHPGTPIP